MKPIINEQNHSKYTVANETYHYKWDECMKANNSINDYLDENLYGNFDWAGKYHSFLGMIGVDAETSNGWWSKQAVSEKYLNLFIDLMNEDGKQDGEIKPSEKLKAYYNLLEARKIVKDSIEIIRA